jgi:hypothetical protein
VTIRSDADGLIYDVSDPRDGWRPRHVGTLMIDTAEAERSAWPAPVNEAALRGEEARDVTAPWVRFSAASACPAASDVVAVHRTGGDLIARLQSASSRTQAGLLHLIWRLIAFSELNGHAPPPKVPFAMERFIVAGALSPELIVRITNEGGAVTVAAHTASGARALLIDRLIAREGADMIEIDVQEEMLQ